MHLGDILKIVKCKDYTFLKHGFVGGINVESIILDVFIDHAIAGLVDHQIVAVDIVLNSKI